MLSLGFALPASKLGAPWFFLHGPQATSEEELELELVMESGREASRQRRRGAPTDLRLMRARASGPAR